MIVETSIEFDPDAIRESLDLPDSFLNEDDVENVVERYIDRNVSQLRSYLSDNEPHIDAERVMDIVRDSGAFMDRDDANYWVRDQLHSIPADPGARCSLGAAFTDAVLTVLHDVVHGTTDRGAMLFGELAVNLAGEGLADDDAQPEENDAHTTFPRLLPWVRDTQWDAGDEDIRRVISILEGVLAARGAAKPVQHALMLNDEEAVLGTRVVIGSFLSWGEAQEWAVRTGRHGSHITIEYPEG
jgi:hypothetical protein